MGGGLHWSPLGVYRVTRAKAAGALSEHLTSKHSLVPCGHYFFSFPSLPPGEYCAFPEFDQQVLARRPRSKDSKLLQQPALFPPARGGNRWLLVWEKVKQAEVWEGV